MFECLNVWHHIEKQGYLLVSNVPIDGKVSFVDAQLEKLGGGIGI